MGTQESPPLAVGTRLDAYEVSEVVEQGRYSYTYLGRDANGTEVLIKEFLPHEFAVRDGDGVRPRDADDKTPLRFWLRSFLDKAVLLQKLNHPGLIRVLKQFEANGTGYYVTERIAGQSLEAILQRGTPLNEAQLRRLLAPLLSGLEQAHAVGLLHRDIRPENILLRGDDSAVLANFGVLRAPIRFKARTVFSAGSPPYAAPEEFFMAGPHGAWTDLYALGATLYRVVTGQPPADARTRATGPALAPVAMNAKVRLTESRAAAIDEALHLPAEQRPQSVAAWRGTLQGSVAAEPEAGAEVDMPAVEYAAERKRSPLPLVIGAVVVIGGAAGAYFMMHSRGGQDAAPQAQPAAAAQAPAAAASQQTAAPAATDSATPAAAAPSAQSGGGDLDRLAMDLMSKEKKLADAREQLQAQQQATQEARAATTSSKPAVTTQAAAPAAAPAPSPAETEAADRLKQLQAEVDRLRKEKETQAATTTVASAAPATRSGPDWPTWYREATGSIRQNLKYPQKSLQSGEEGDLMVKVHVRRDGSILRTELAQRSSYSALNQEALDVFSRIGRFAPLPSDYQPGSAEVDLNMPINFKLSD